MQDWSYYWHNDLQITVELSNQKYPDYSQVANYWNQNKKSLYNFLEVGISGIGINNPEKHQLKMSISNESENVFESDINSAQFFKILPSGDYQVLISNKDGLLLRKRVTVANNSNYLSIK